MKWGPFYASSWRDRRTAAVTTFNVRGMKGLFMALVFCLAGDVHILFFWGYLQ